MPKREVVRIPFHKTELFAFSSDKPETALVAMQPIVESMGLDWKSQQRTMKNHPVIRDAVSTYTLRLPTDDRARKHTFMQVGMIRFWMGQINPHLVRAELRPDIIVYQKECANVLHAHFSGSAVSARVIHDGELSAENRAIHGGITKGIVSKAIEPLKTDVASVKQDLAANNERQEQMAAVLAKVMAMIGPVADGFDPTRIKITGFSAMLAILVVNGVTDPKGRRKLSSRCSQRLLRWCTANERKDPKRRREGDNKLVFRLEDANAWLEAEGREIIAEHLNSLTGQLDLDLGRAKRRKKSTASKQAEASGAAA